MSNLAYCRFRNTLSDLEDCAEALFHGVAEKDPRERDAEEPLSEEEREALKDLLRVCKRITDNYDFYKDD